MKTSKKVLLIVLAIFIVIQFIRPAKNQSSAATPNDIFEHYAAGGDVKQLIRTACYNCHSNNTVYPWYNNIQPVAWWLDHHIKEGKRELNFSEFTTYTGKKQDHKLEEVGDEVKGKKMPLPSYLIIHSEAQLTDQQQAAIVKWAEETRKQVKK